MCRLGWEPRQEGDTGRSENRTRGAGDEAIRRPCWRVPQEGCGPGSITHRDMGNPSRHRHSHCACTHIPQDVNTHTM